MSDAARSQRSGQALDDRRLAHEVIKPGGTVFSVQSEFGNCGLDGHGADFRPVPVTALGRPASGV
jgi:hypothetical protein